VSSAVVDLRGAGRGIMVSVNSYFRRYRSVITCTARLFPLCVEPSLPGGRVSLRTTFAAAARLHGRTARNPDFCCGRGDRHCVQVVTPAPLAQSLASANHLPRSPSKRADRSHVQAPSVRAPALGPPAEREKPAVRCNFFDRYGQLARERRRIPNLVYREHDD